MGPNRPRTRLKSKGRKQIRTFSVESKSRPGHGHVCPRGYGLPHFQNTKALLQAGGTFSTLKPEVDVHISCPAIKKPAGESGGMALRLRKIRR